MRTAPRHMSWRLWSCLLLVALAELLTATASPPLGLAIHALLLVWLTLYATAGQPGPERNLILGLTLAPLIRILSLSLPLLHLPWMAWYPAVALPLLVATWFIVRILRLTPGQLGLRIDGLAVQLTLAGWGLALGAIEYQILKPAPLVAGLQWEMLLLAALLLIVFTGFVEELVFRGVLLSLGLAAMGAWGVLYVSLLFAIMHIGYLSVVDLVFVFAVGSVFAVVVRWTGSIVGVTLAHGITNVTLFLIMPALAQEAAADLAPVASLILVGGTVVGVVGLALIARPHVVPRIRRARRLDETGARRQSGQAPARGHRGNSAWSASTRDLARIPLPASGKLATGDAAITEQLVSNMQAPFLSLVDPRSARGRRYPLPAILVVAVCARLSGAPSFYATARWALSKPRLWARLSPHTAHPPSARTFHRVLSQLDPIALEEALREWASLNLSGSDQVVQDERRLPSGEGGVHLLGGHPRHDYALQARELVDIYVQMLDDQDPSDDEPGDSPPEDPTATH